MQDTERVEATQPAHASGAGRSKQHAAIAVVSTILTVFTIFKLLGLIAIQLLAVPACIDVFQDFDTELPTLTIILISTPTAMWVAAYLLTIIGLIAKEFLPFISPVARCVIDLVVMMLCFVLFFFYGLALFLPMVSLQESLM